MTSEALLPPLRHVLHPWRDFLASLAARGGPKEGDYAALDGWISTLADALEAGTITPLELQLLWAEGGPATSSTQTMQGFARVKPHGYAGDFELIDRIYQEWHSPDPSLAGWDRYFHTRGAARAIRNAKDYFVRWLKIAEAGRSEKAWRLNLLYLGGGPARELLDFFGRRPGNCLHCTYMDPDPEAIAYARQLCASLKGRVHFWQNNPLGPTAPAVSPDLIWAGSLLDYLDDANAGSLLGRLWRLLAPGGEIVAAGFSPQHPTRPFFDLIGWPTAGRDPASLARLALRAGIPDRSIRLSQEPEAIIHFLHLSSNQ